MASVGCIGFRMGGNRCVPADRPAPVRVRKKIRALPLHPADSARVHLPGSGATLVFYASSAIIVEGPFDASAVTLADPGRYAGLAPCGTALTTRQAAAVLPAGRARLLPGRQEGHGADRVRAAHRPLGRPVAVRVFEGNTGDPAAFTEITKLAIMRRCAALDGFYMLRTPVPPASSTHPAW